MDWGLCLLRTGLAFTYLWEAEFYCRVHDMVARRLGGGTASNPSPISALLQEVRYLRPSTRPVCQPARRGFGRQRQS